MQHLDDAHERAERRLAACLMNKSRDWRALLVKDVLARLRVILWCPDRSWESGRREIDGELNKVGSPQTGVGGLRRDRRVGEGCWQFT